MIHILNGDSLLGKFPIELKGERIVVRECLIEGDVSAANLSEFYNDRASFLFSTYGTSKSDYVAKTRSAFERISQLNPQEPVFCWFEKDLFCQTNFWFICDLLVQNGQQNVSLVLAENLELGFSALSRKELAKALETHTPLSKVDLSNFSQLWKAYQTKNFDKLLEIEKKLHLKFPFLKDVILAEITKGSKDNKGKPMEVLEELLLSKQSTDLREIFPEFSKRLSIYGYGDLQVKRMIKEWEDQYLFVNKTLWDKKVPVHFDSNFYDNPGFRESLNSLNQIEMDLLGDLDGQKVLHLQCHFGQDTISLQKLGAEATGVDFSEPAIEKARDLSEQCQLFPEFVCSDIYALDKNLKGQFDLIFTSYGTIGWLPDLNKWAGIIDHFLKPGGTFLIVEFHPMIWVFDDHFKKIVYSYFNRAAIVEKEEYSYTDGAAIELNSVTWNHPFSEVFGALLSKNMVIDDFQEYDYSPYDCFSNTVKTDEDKYQIKGMEGKLPMVYSLKVTKPASNE